ncbi:hypothetical protein C0J52_26365 [Blattella germanica]|nr:hypothetical protein C0J52_26365 [Blattella germanica]PSN34871.1 hypothetical protein C0J52_26365 [Blattella germanica]
MISFLNIHTLLYLMSCLYLITLNIIRSSIHVIMFWIYIMLLIICPWLVVFVQPLITVSCCFGTHFKYLLVEFIETFFYFSIFLSSIIFQVMAETISCSLLVTRYVIRVFVSIVLSLHHTLIYISANLFFFTTNSFITQFCLSFSCLISIIILLSFCFIYINMVMYAGLIILTEQLELMNLL